MILGSFIDKIITFFKITSFIETGTFLGATSSNMAKIYPDLPIFTCEINKIHYQIAKEELKQYKNVQILKNSSEVFLAKILKETNLFKLPLIFLDAFHEFELVVEQECLGQGILKERIDQIKLNAEERFKIKHTRMLDKGDFI